MQKDSFSDPFFTDPNHFEKGQRKFMVVFVTLALISITSFVLLWWGIISGLEETGNQIQKQGGLGKSIGKFIHDVKSEADKK